jgi:hypothetical protein
LKLMHKLFQCLMLLKLLKQSWQTPFSAGRNRTCMDSFYPSF